MPIRPMTMADAERVSILSQLAREASSWTELDYVNLLEGAEGVFGFIAEDAEPLTGMGPIPVGFIFCRLALDEAEILNLAVQPQARRRGTGYLLGQAAVSHALSSGARRVLLEVRGSNAAALALYEKLGFRQVASRKGYYHSPSEDALILARDLP